MSPLESLAWTAVAIVTLNALIIGYLLILDAGEQRVKRRREAQIDQAMRVANDRWSER